MRTLAAHEVLDVAVVLVAHVLNQFRIPLEAELLSHGPWPRVHLRILDGDLEELLRRDSCVVVETYPAEACLHLGMKPPGSAWSKRRQMKAAIVTLDASVAAVLRACVGSHAAISAPAKGKPIMAMRRMIPAAWKR